MEPAATPHRSSQVSLRLVTEETVRDICKLSVSEEQQQFVAPNATSIAQAHFSDYAWFRGVYADDIAVGFVMLDDRPQEPLCFLWRFMIDTRYQGLGFGRRAMQQVMQHIRGRANTTSFLTSVVQAAGGPQPFYEGLGFVATGEFVDGEAILRLALGDADNEQFTEPVFLPTELYPRLVPSLWTNDMPGTLSFYKQLGFEVRDCHPDRANANRAEVKRDSVRLEFHTQPPDSALVSPQCCGTFYFYPTNLADLIKEFENKVAFAWGPKVMEQGQREFGVCDPNGYRLAFRELA